MRFLPAIATVLLLLPHPAAAQAWWEPFQRGEYEKAAAILHAAWAQLPADPKALHAEYDVPEMLGRIYWEGRGVQADPVLACSFYELAASNVGMRPFVDPDPEKLRVRRIHEERCERLNPQERRDAVEMLGCAKFGAEVQTYALDGSRLLRVDRLRITLEDRGRERVMPSAIPCNSRIVLGRLTRSATNTPGSAKPAVFFDLFFWTTGKRSGERALAWHRYEVLDDKLEMRDNGVLGEQPGAPWMAGDPPLEWINRGDSEH